MCSSTFRKGGGVVCQTCLRPENKHWAGIDTRNKPSLHLSCPSIFHFKKAGPSENTSSGTNQVFYSSPSLSLLHRQEKAFARQGMKRSVLSEGSLFHMPSQKLLRGTRADTHTQYFCSFLRKWVKKAVCSKSGKRKLNIVRDFLLFARKEHPKPMGVRPLSGWCHGCLLLWKLSLCHEKPLGTPPFSRSLPVWVFPMRNEVQGLKKSLPAGKTLVGSFSHLDLLIFNEFMLWLKLFLHLGHL